MHEGNGFKLEVPLDASQVRDFKPDRPVKVIAYGSKGKTQEETVSLNEEGRGTASFYFPERPGLLSVALGPANASAEDLKHLQTISLNVPASFWQNQAEVRLQPVAISSYYYWWWWRWCQNYTLTGRVLCADGSPVIGANVCAFDVDWWWWWTSQEQVGCATTDSTGSFQINFTRCCGWWPWWWWLTREWQLDPIVVDRITDFLKQNPKFNLLPKATPKPSLDVFQQLLVTGGKSTRPGLAPNLASSAQIAVNSEFDAATLESLRSALLEALPPDFPIRIWPWYPWYPWWDCDANIIFQVTQNCGGQTQTIVSETIFDTRWDIPANLNVTLTANDQACCAYTCTDPDQCPDGNCIVPSDICDINVGSIGGNVGNVSTPAQVGLYNPGVEDRPFAGSADIFGVFGSGANVDYYEFLYSTVGQAGPYNPLPLAAVGGFDRTHLVVLPGPVFTWPLVPFPVNTISDSSATNHYVIETIAHYEANNGVQTWDAATHDLLMVLQSLNVLANGSYWLQLVGWQRPGYTGDLTNPVTLAVCDPNPQDPPVSNWWAVNIDNRAPGNTDPSGQTCGLHICTDQPTSAILQVAIVNASGTTVVQGCDNICITDADTLQIDFAAYDPDGFLYSYGLELLYGLDQSINLLCTGSPGCLPATAAASWSLTASPIAPAWAPAPLPDPIHLGQYQVGPDYAAALGQGAVSPVWSGGSMRLSVNAAQAFPQTCAYLLQLNVYKRPIVNCDSLGNYDQNNVSFESFTIQVNCTSSNSSAS